MDGEPQLLYLEPDDEITSVIRRLRGADAGRVVLVAPGRSRATSSVVALRLLARAASEAGRSVALVADASTRSLAAEAGIAAFGSVVEATSPNPAPPAPIAPTRAPIHVVRGAAPARARPPSTPKPTDGLDETVAVHLPPPSSAAGGSRLGRRWQILPWPWLAAILIVAMAAGAALLPGATVRITPATVAVGPRSYPITVAIDGHLTNQLEATRPGTATGERLEEVAATGVVTFFNWNTVSVEVPQGTHVSVSGTTAFVTLQRIVVPRGRFGAPIEPGEKSVQVAAVVPGTGGNVAARAIDTIDDSSVKAFLRGFPDNPNRLVVNDDPTTGGLATSHPVIQQSDIDTAVAAVEADLRQQLADALVADPDRAYAATPESEVPSIEIPDELLGTEDVLTFELTGSLSVDRPYASRANVEAAAALSLLADPGAAPDGTTILEDSIAVEIGSATASGDALLVSASVTAAAAGDIDEADIANRIAGLTVDEARAELAPLGEIAVELWPAWVDRLPRLTFRIGVETVVPSPSESASP